MFRRLAYAVLDRAGYLVTLAFPHLYDWIAGQPPETPTDHAIREEGEQVRKAFPEIDFDDPMPKREMRR
jgi:hypothetical protein